VAARVWLGPWHFRLFFRNESRDSGVKCTKGDEDYSKRLTQQATTRVRFILLFHYFYFWNSYYYVFDTHFFIFLYFILYYHECLSILVLRGKLCWNLNLQLLFRSLLIHWLCFVCICLVWLLMNFLGGSMSQAKLNVWLFNTCAVYQHHFKYLR
jgi:hypothetical protein